MLILHLSCGFTTVMGVVVGMVVMVTITHTGQTELPTYINSLDFLESNSAHSSDYDSFTTVNWWSRSSNVGNSNNIWITLSDGSPSSQGYAFYSYGVAAACLIG